NLLQDGRRSPSYGTQEGVKPVGLLLHYCQLRHAGLRHCEAAVCWNEEVTIFLEGRIHHPVMAIPRHNIIEESLLGLRTKLVRDSGENDDQVVPRINSLGYDRRHVGGLSGLDITYDQPAASEAVSFGVGQKRDHLVGGFVD